MKRQNRHFITAAFGGAGLLCAVALISFGDTSDLRHLNASNTHLLLISGPSAAIAGLACAGMFGHGGGWGWFFAGAGALLSTILGAAIGGTLLAPLLGTLFAPMIVFWNLVAFPIAGLLWLTSMAALHFVSLKVRGYGVGGN